MRILIIGLCIFSFLNFYTTADDEGDFCITPNNEVSLCLGLQNCPVLYHALSNRDDEIQKSFLKNSVCGYQGHEWGSMPLVCCGTMPNYEHILVNPDKSWVSQSTTTQNGKRLETTYSKPTTIKPSTSKPTPGPVKTLSTTDLTYLERLLPSRNVCGRSEDADRILGGTEARLGDYPWMAQLFYRQAGTGVVIPFYNMCGGTLISKNYVITAAHCLVGRIQRDVGPVHGVRLGEHDITKEIDCYDDQGCNEKVLDVLVVEAIAHEGFLVKGNERNLHNDIGLLRLAKNVDFTDFISPICLPIYGETVQAGQKVNVAGWGSLNAGGTEAAKIKMKLAVTVWDLSQCSDIYMNVSKIRLFNKQICAGGEAGKDSCVGDSGGPLMTRIPRSHLWYLEGIVSFGPSTCGTKDRPGVYTKVSAYLDWISHHIRP